MFAFANAGSTLSLGDIGSSVTLAVFMGFAFGKPVGILTFRWLALRAGITTRPPDLGWRLLIGGGLLAGIGFTIPMFVASLAFSPSLIDSPKLGIFLASVFSALAGIALLAELSAAGKQSRTARP